MDWFGILTVRRGGLIEEACTSYLGFEAGKVDGTFFPAWRMVATRSGCCVGSVCRSFFVARGVLQGSSLIANGIFGTGHEDEIAECFGGGFGADIALGAAYYMVDGGGLFVDEGFLLSHGGWFYCG